MGIAVLFTLVGIVLLVLAPGTLEISAVTVAFQVVFALGIAAVVIAVIMSIMYMYETRLKSTYEARLMRLEKSLNDAASPLKVFLAIFGTIVWLVILNLFWTGIPFVATLGDNPQFLRLFTPGFASFVLWFNVLGVLGIAVQLLFLVIRQKWIPALMEVFVGIGTALLFAWIMAVMPFNPELAPVIFTGIKVFLALVIALTMFDAGRKLWNTARLFLHERPGHDSSA
jgi:hypothetical protein